MRLSVITPFYNTLSRLGRAWMEGFVASLASQQDLGADSKEVEHVWIDDGSDDDTFKELASLAKANGLLNIRLLKSDANKGPSCARNAAIAESQGEWIAYVDSDDLLSPDRESVLLRATAGDWDISFAPYWRCEDGGLDLYDLKALLAERGLSVDQLSQLENPSVPLGVCHRGELWERAGGFPPGVVSGEDGILWRRMLCTGKTKASFLGPPAGYYFIRADSQSRTERKFGTGLSIALDRSHPAGSNGQYLDEPILARLQTKSL